jgi:hypothetical protein
MEVINAKVKGLYGEIKGIYESVKDLKSYSVSEHTVNTYNSLVDELVEITNGNYSRSKIPFVDPGKRGYDTGDYVAEMVKPVISGLMRKLEEEYEFGRNQSQPGVVLINKNHNNASIEISYTIENLIENEQDEEVKKKLIELDEALNKKDKVKITNLLKWILEKGFDLFLSILPIILQNYSK